MNKPTLLILSLDDHFQDGVFDDMYKHVIAGLLSKAHLKRAKTPEGALKVLDAPDPLRGVYITDPGVMARKHRPVAEKIIAYGKGGGIVVFGCYTSSGVRPNDLGNMFKFWWGLEWTAGSYHRTSWAPNPTTAGLTTTGLPTYSQKSLNLSAVQKPHRVYLPVEDARIESHVFAPDPISSHAETPVAFGKVGEGWVGWTGDVNAEEPTTAVVLRMFGLA